MPSHTLPITNRSLGSTIPTPSSSASSVATTMLLGAAKKNVEDDDDDPSASLLHSSSFNGINKVTMPIKPFLSRASSFTSIDNNNNKASVVAPCFYQKRRRRTASEDSLPSSAISNGSDRSRSSSFGNDVRHVASETFLLTRLGLKMLRYLGYDSDLNC